MSANSGAASFDLAGLMPGEIDHRHDAAHDGRELDQAVLFQFLGLERHVGGAEIDGLGLDLLDAAARTDRLIVHA